MCKEKKLSPEEIKAVAETLKIFGDMTASKPNEWLPVFAALGGAVAGAIASFFPTWLIEKRRESAFSKQIQNCLVAEVSSLVEIIEHRNYLAAIKAAVNHLKLNPKDKYSLVVDVPPHYSRVYQDNCKHIGVVDAQVAREIITFHQLIDAVIQDMKSDGPFSSGASLETFEEMESIFERAICIGRKLTAAHNKQLHRIP